MKTRSERTICEPRHSSHALLVSLLFLGATGCGFEPSDRELKNARAFEALLTAVSLQNSVELEQDAKTIKERHASGELSESRFKAIWPVVEKARAKDWGTAEKLAYEFRAQFGDNGAYFK